MDMNNNYQNNGYQNNGYNQSVQPAQNYQQPTYSGTPINQGTKPVTGWNWGAFMFNWCWGIANGTYLPLLIFVPFLNLIWMFVCGAKGNEWAMNSGMWKTVEEFNAVQKSWNKAGKFMFWFMVIMYGIAIVLWILMFVLALAGVSTGLSELSYY